MDNYNFRPNNTTTNNTNTNSFFSPYSTSVSSTEVRPVIFPQHQQAFRQQPNDNNNTNEHNTANDNGKIKSFKNNDDNNNSNDNKKTPVTLSDSDLLINTNKKRLSVDYILT